jgi:hypothetical protein
MGTGDTGEMRRMACLLCRWQGAKIKIVPQVINAAAVAGGPCS